MRIFRNQQGFGHLVLFLGLAVLVAVSLVGYRVLKSTETNPAATSTVSKSAVAPSAIKNRADLVQASQALDNTGIDGNVNPSQLDSDLNSLL